MKDTETGRLIDLLSNQSDTPVRFFLDGVSINQGYHLTEVKHASIKSMDCGRRTDSWEEILIQLLDGPADSTEGFMSASKFVAILSATLESFTMQSAPVLFFEFTPENGPLLKLSIVSIECNDQEVSIQLTHETAVCKLLQDSMSVGAAISELSANAKTPACCSSDKAC